MRLGLPLWTLTMPGQPLGITAGPATVVAAQLPQALGPEALQQYIAAAYPTLDATSQAPLMPSRPSLKHWVQAFKNDGLAVGLCLDQDHNDDWMLLPLTDRMIQDKVGQGIDWSNCAHVCSIHAGLICRPVWYCTCQRNNCTNNRFFMCLSASGHPPSRGLRHQISSAFHLLDMSILSS